MEEIVGEVGYHKFPQEVDLVLRSNKKFKRKSTEDPPQQVDDTVMEEPPNVSRTHKSAPLMNPNSRITFKDMLSSNNPHFQGLMPRHFDESEEEDKDCSDDEILDSNV